MSSRAHAQAKAESKPTYINPFTRLLQRKPTSVGILDEHHGKSNMLQRRAVNNDELSEVPPIVYEVLRSPGQPLDKETRGFFESRIGHDYSKVRVHSAAITGVQTQLTINKPGDIYEREADYISKQVMSESASMPSASALDLDSVRVHTDDQALESARLVNARAYTVGNNIVFSRGQYAPSTAKGRRLLAHELTHVAQQEGGSVGIIQRAEVDDRSCAGLTDIESDIDTKVNSEIAAARTAAGIPISVPAFLRDVMTRLGQGIVSPMENFIEALPTSKRTLPPSNLAGTKYSGAGGVYSAQRWGAHVVGSAAKIHGICVGADKLGHFFQEGYVYFQIAAAPGGTAAKAESAGRALEIGIEGLSATGVYSKADLTANRAGMQFYNDLKANPSLNFSIKNYITDKWNEQTNPSFYSSSMGSVVWSNLLAGLWQSTFTSGGSGAPIASKVNLNAATGSMTGTYEYPTGATTLNKGKIKNGTITQRTTSVAGTWTFPGEPESSASATPVSGVSIEFDWEDETSSGKGKWDSLDEQTLSGTWGFGSSRTNGGIWRLKKA